MSGYGALVDAAWAKAVEMGLDKPSKIGLDIVEVQQMLEAALGGLQLPVPAEPAGWQGWRLTLNCGHLELTDLDDRQIGQSTSCDMCPLAESDSIQPVRQRRVIVGRERVVAPEEPETVPSEFWYST